MTLDELGESEVTCCEGEVTEETSELEEDLGEALDLLEQVLESMELICVKGGRVTRVPRGLFDLMQEVSEYLEQWGMGGEPEEEEEKPKAKGRKK